MSFSLQYMDLQLAGFVGRPWHDPSVERMNGSSSGRPQCRWHVRQVLKFQEHYGKPQSLVECISEAET